jgi:hypothetical protein
MINYELTDKNLISDCATKDGKLIDYINTKLFNNNFPIKIVDHRSKYSNDNLFKMKKSNIIFHQNEKYALGSNYKLSISSLVNSKYSGFFSFKLGDKTIQCNYYTILPKNKTDWINDEICNNNYKKFNMNNNSSILYLVSGQNVGFETFNKIKEIGLTYLENRLLVLADLDGLKNLKYSILSSARNGVIKNMLYKSLIKNILINIENIKELYDLNDYIFKKRIEQPLSQKQLLKINKALSKALKKYKAINKVKMFTDVVPRIEVVDSSVEEKKYADYFTKFEIMTTKHIFDTKDVCNIVLLTNAKLTINQTVAINVYLIKNELKDNKEDTDQDFNNEFVENSQITTTDYETKYQNGRIIYKFKLPIGEYGIYFSHKQNADKIVKSNSLIFTVVDDLPKKKERNIKIPNIKVNYVTTGKRIADINEIDNQTYIDIYASHPDLREFIQEYKDNIDEFKEKFAVNLAL